MSENSLNKKTLHSKDIAFAAINGAIFGAFLPTVLTNTDAGITLETLPSIALFSISAAIGVAVGYALSKFARFLFQLAKFGTIGASNTAIDIGLLNVLVFLTGTTSGIFFTLFKTLSFTAALFNSYFWNKYWSFEKKETKDVKKEFAQFLGVSLAGAILNVTTAYIVNDVIGPQGNIDPKQWLNIAAASGSIIVLTWNFLGYKLFVFKK
ncbi:MAG: GtrA family protein [Candidatus Moranbacteria bacterium]|nr:GtrA family protein [Candidatus Moranbacteria bacterium]